MGRKPNPVPRDFRRITVEVDPALEQAIRDYAASMGRTKTAVVADALDEYLARHAGRKGG